MLSNHPPTIRISHSTSFHDCECCGFFDLGSATIELPDGRKLEAEHDGHFGGGCWDGKPEHLYFWALQALGVELRVNGEPVWENPYQEQDSEYQWQLVELAPAGKTVLNLLVKEEPDPEDPGYLMPVSVHWTSANGVERSLRAVAAPKAPDEWDGCVSSLYRALLEERAQVIEG